MVPPPESPAPSVASTPPAPASVPTRVTVIVNPERHDLTEPFVAALAGCDVTLVEPDSADGVAAVAAGISAADADVVAAVGGDGTQRIVAGALAGRGIAQAVVPAGTVNLLGRVLGIHDVADAAAAAGGGSRRTIDLGRCDDDVFVLNASTGYDANVIRRVDDGAKRLGRLGYFANGVRQLLRDRARPVTIDLDGERWFAGDALTVLVLNFGQRGSERVFLAPDAAPDDGLLDVVVIRRGALHDVARTALAVVRGARPDPADLVAAQAGRITVEWEAAVCSQRDGDGGPLGTRFEYAVVPGAVAVCTPPAGRDGAGEG